MRCASVWADAMMPRQGVLEWDSAQGVGGENFNFLKQQVPADKHRR